jgi:hypothetical protein
MIMNQKKIALAKVNHIQNGYSAFSENQELTRLIKRELTRQNIDIIEDATNVGSWFIPVTDR